MTLREQIMHDLKQAMRDGDRDTVAVLRMVQSAIKNAEIENRGGDAEDLSEAQVLAIVQKEAKKRKESMAAFHEGGRPELAEKEEAELAIISRYLPEELSEEEIRQVVKKAIEEVGAQTSADFGAVMKQVMADTKGRADGKEVSRIVREELG